MKTNTFKSPSFIHDFILANLKEFTVVDQFLTHITVSMFKDEELPRSENEIFQYMIKYKQLSQISLNLYQNYSYAQKCQILEHGQSKELHSFIERDNWCLSDDTDNNMIIPNTDTIVDYIKKYISSYAALQKLEHEKEFYDLKSLMKSVCFYCDNRLDRGHCRICISNSMDMREYAQKHHRTLRKLKNSTQSKTVSTFSKIIMESNNDNQVSKLEYDQPAEKRSLDGLLDSSQPIDNWICNQCSFNNMTDSANCVICFQINDDEIIPPNKPIEQHLFKNNQNNDAICFNKVTEENNSPIKKSESTKHTMVLTKKWRCWNPKCFKTNGNHSNYCKKCGFQRKVARIFFQSINNKLVEWWMCDICCFINDAKTQKCPNCSKCLKRGCTKFWVPID